MGETEVKVIIRVKNRNLNERSLSFNETLNHRRVGSGKGDWQLNQFA